LRHGVFEWNENKKAVLLQGNHVMHKIVWQQAQHSTGHSLIKQLTKNKDAHVYLNNLRFPKHAKKLY